MSNENKIKYVGIAGLGKFLEFIKDIFAPVDGVAYITTDSSEDITITEEVNLEITTAINSALASAKASGQFDGEDGKTPVKGEDYWTEADKNEIINEVLARIPNGNEVAY